MKRFISKLFAGSTKTTRTDRRVRLSVETMEERLALSSTRPLPLAIPSTSSAEVRVIIIEGGRTSQLEMRGFNPQPEPPGSQLLNPGTLRGFNPQPEPPGSPLLNPGTLKGFNPQPEPPGTPALKVGL